MDADYPEHLLAREPAPQYRGEGPFALWHYSEDPSLGRFLPRRGGTSPARPLVWAVDTRHAPMFWFPRDCPRGCIWPVSATTAADRERFFGQAATSRVHVMEAGWLGRVRECRLYAYRLPTEAFRPHEVGGYWVADTPVEALERVVIDDLVGRHADAGIELRITPSIWPFWRRVATSTVAYSGSRLRNARSTTMGRMEDMEVPEREAGRVIAIDPAGRILLFRYDDPPPKGAHWATPGGGLEDGEDFYAAACRELTEETGWADVPVTPGEVHREQNMQWSHTRGRQVFNEDRYFVGRVAVERRPLAEVAAMHVSDGIHEARWWTLAELDATADNIYPKGLADLVRRLR